MEPKAQIETGKAIGYGWKTVKKDLVYFVLIALIVQVFSMMSLLIKDQTISSIISFLVLIIGIFLTAGYLKISFSYYDGKKLPLNELFKQGKYFINLLGAQLLVGLIVIAGLILFIVPGIIWGLKYQMTLNLIVDKDLDILEAMRQSAEITKGVKLQLLVFNFACLGVMILGALALGVGVLVAMPVLWLAGIYVYRHLLKNQNVQPV